MKRVYGSHDPTVSVASQAKEDVFRKLMSKHAAFRLKFAAKTKRRSLTTLYLSITRTKR